MQEGEGGCTRYFLQYCHFPLRSVDTHLVSQQAHFLSSDGRFELPRGGEDPAFPYRKSCRKIAAFNCFATVHYVGV